MIVSHDLGVWLAALLTLFIFSFLYRDNPLYKFAEHLFVGVSAGYYVVINYWTVIDSNLIQPLRAAFGGHPEGGPWHASLGDYRGWLVLPGILGVLLLTRMIGRISWASRWALAVIIGVYAGLKTTGFAQGDLVAQVQASLNPLLIPGDLWASFNALLFTVGLLSSLLYFFYSREHRGALGWTSKIGIWFLMVSFGAGYGYTVMSRVSLLIGRFQFLFEDWLHLR
ncbi:MAG: hypothetical protein IT347_00850 [Candidatus Eisenbacteria bacterium]|nr:hypothetical protein [Candidatus Eisenbacteria bacterium]